MISPFLKPEHGTSLRKHSCVHVVISQDLDGGGYFTTSRDLGKYSVSVVDLLETPEPAVLCEKVI